MAKKKVRRKVAAGASRGSSGSKPKLSVRDKRTMSSLMGLANGVVTAARSAGVEWLVIEQDEMNHLNAKESLERSYSNLKPLVG